MVVLCQLNCMVNKLIDWIELNWIASFDIAIPRFFIVIPLTLKMRPLNVDGLLSQVSLIPHSFYALKITSIWRRKHKHHIILHFMEVTTVCWCFHWCCQFCFSFWCCCCRCCYLEQLHEIVNDACRAYVMYIRCFKVFQWISFHLSSRSDIHLLRLPLLLYACIYHAQSTQIACI